MKTEAGLASHQGYWLGDLNLPDGQSLPLGVEIFTRADGSVWASFASPKQGAYDIPVVRIQEAGPSADLEVAFGAMRLNWAGDHFSGEWKQGGSVFPVILKRVSEFPRTHRPQTPVPPYPYREETLAIKSQGGVTLGATLTVPNSPAKPDLVVLVHGSGPATRDEEIAGHRVFAVLADQLARRGIAVLRYDKRGISRSTGDYAAHTQKELAEDLAAVIGAVHARGQFGRVGVVGHSEGPMIAAKVAVASPETIDFLVSLGGVGLPGVEMIALQDRVYARDQGATPQEVERLMAYVRSYYQTIVENEAVDARIAALKGLAEGLPAEDKALIKKYKMNVGSLSLAQAQTPALRSLLLADPQADWRRVKCPVLALNGELDHQVPVDSLAGLVSALKEGGNERVEAAVLPSINHLLQTARTGAEDEYSTIDETVAPIVISTIVDFVGRQR